MSADDVFFLGNAATTMTNGGATRQGLSGLVQPRTLLPDAGAAAAAEVRPAMPVCGLALAVQGHGMAAGRALPDLLCATAER